MVRYTRATPLSMTLKLTIEQSKIDKFVTLTAYNESGKIAVTIDCQALWLDDWRKKGGLPSLRITSLMRSI